MARGLSYLAVNNVKNAASDLDDAVAIDPQNVQAWVSRGLAYERLGDKQKAAGSYARAMNIDQSYQPAREPASTASAANSGRPIRRLRALPKSMTST